MRAARLCSPSRVSQGDVVLCMRSPRRLIQWYLSGLRAEDNEKCQRTYGLCLQARLPGLTSMEGSLRSPRRDESQAPGYRWDRSQRMTDWLSFAQWCIGGHFARLRSHGKVGPSRRNADRGLNVAFFLYREERARDSVSENLAIRTVATVGSTRGLCSDCCSGVSHRWRVDSESRISAVLRKAAR